MKYGYKLWHNSTYLPVKDKKTPAFFILLPPPSHLLSSCLYRCYSTSPPLRPLVITYTNSTMMASATLCYRVHLKLIHSVKVANIQIPVFKESC